MRINVYNEELTNDVQIVTTRALETGREYIGLRFYLLSHDALHHVPGDDDRSAVTFWIGDKARAEQLLNAAKSALDYI